MVCDIVIVNWNAGEMLADCVRSIAAHAVGSVSKVIIVDNGSTDQSLSGLDSLDLSVPVEVIRNEKNLGFGAACNQGAAAGASPYVLFLNPDTLLHNQESVSRPIAHLEHNPTVGIVGIQLVDASGHVTTTCSRFPTLSRLISSGIGLNRLPRLKASGMVMKEWRHDETRPVDQVMGAFFLMRRDLFQRLGGFDERFFVYFEEVDLAYRAKQAGYASAFLAEAQAFHEGGGTTRQVKARRLFYSLRSRFQYVFKHFPKWQAVALVLVSLTAEPITRLAFSVMSRDWEGIKATAHGYQMLIYALLARQNGQVA